MCDTCGCGDTNAIRYSIPGEVHSHEHIHEHEHEHKHDGIIHSHIHVHKHSHEHYHDENELHGSHHKMNNDEHPHLHGNENLHEHTHSKEIILQRNILSKNDLMAERNRGYFEAKNITVFNLVSSPGSGKTTLLEKTIPILVKKNKKVFVIEGDQQSMNDAERIHKTGVPVIQINTGNACHLDAEMINKAIKKLNVSDNSIVFIENVGNLVCPSLFDLGEKKRVLILSVTEGDDKPLKYPNMFATANICIINKMDIIDYTDFDLFSFKENALKVNHKLEFIEVSARTEEGLTKWIDWLTEE